MKDITIGKGGNSGRTFFGYGPSGGGKTRWAATFPRPVFFSAAHERGWETINNMPAELFFEKDRPPVVWAMDKPEDIKEGIDRLRGIMDKDPLQFRTVVIDSDTHFLDLYLTKVENDLAGTKFEKEPRNAYRELWKRYGFDTALLHAISTNYGLNVIHLALDKEPTQESPGGGPLLIGQAAKKIPSMCEYVMYFRYWRDSPASPHRWEIRTKSYERNNARGRDEGRLPDPLPAPTYKAMAEILGWPMEVK